jgi:hypothetical protein
MQALRSAFPTDDSLVAGQLLTEQELGRLQMEGEVQGRPQWPYWRPGGDGVVGAAHLVHDPHQKVPPAPCHPTTTKLSAKNVQKIIPSDHKELLRGLVKFKEGLEAVQGHDHIQVPPVYKQVGKTILLFCFHQVVDVATYFYFAMSLVGSQELETSEARLYFPIILVLKFVFFVGWLKVADAIAHPFGEDEDDFQIGELVSRHIWVRPTLQLRTAPHCTAL